MFNYPLLSFPLSKLGYQLNVYEDYIPTFISAGPMLRSCAYSSRDFRFMIIMLTNVILEYLI